LFHFKNKKTVFPVLAEKTVKCKNHMRVFLRWHYPVQVFYGVLSAAISLAAPITAGKI
jgi:hypothetical protein